MSGPWVRILPSAPNVIANKRMSQQDMPHNFAIGDHVYIINDSKPTIILKRLGENGYLAKLPNGMISSVNDMLLEVLGYDPMLDISNNPNELRLNTN